MDDVAAVWQVALATMAFEVMRRAGLDASDARFVVEQATAPYTGQKISAEVMAVIVDEAVELAAGMGRGVKRT